MLSFLIGYQMKGAGGSYILDFASPKFFLEFDAVEFI